MANVLNIGAQFRAVKTGSLQAPFNSGQVSTIELPRSLFFKKLYLRLSGTISVTVGGTAVVAEAPLRLIRKIEIVGDGVKTLISRTANDLFREMHILEGKQPELTGPAGFGIQANTPIAALIPIPFEAVRMRSPVDSYLDPRGYESLQLRITWGAITDIITGGTATVNAGTIVDVLAEQTIAGEANIAFRRILTYDENAIAGVSSALTFNIPRNGLLAGILFHADVDGVPNDALINSLTIKSDNTNLHADRLVWETFRKANVMDFNLDSSVFGSGINGYVYLNFCEDGMLSSALNTYNLNTLQVIYDCNAPGAVRFVRQSYVFYEPIQVG